MTTDIERFKGICGRLQALSNEIMDTDTNAAIQRVTDVCNHLDKAWCGGFIGYHSRIYTADLAPKRAGQHFDLEWGTISVPSNTTTEGWAEFTEEAIYEFIVNEAGAPELGFFIRKARSAQQDFLRLQRELDAILAAHVASNDTFAAEERTRLAKITYRFPPGGSLQVMIGKNSIATRDPRALSKGIETPPHLRTLEKVIEVKAARGACEDAAGIAAQFSSYLEMRMTSKADTGRKIFLGHGGSSVWKEVKDFLTDRLSLDYVEFNRQSPAGIPTQERLLEMLNEATFAFIILTAEDEHADGTHHARENAIHEAGLFQGRIGFRRAIVLLEEGCEEFSNIKGLGQIRFSKAKVSMAFEEIRKVLERERVI